MGMSPFHVVAYSMIAFVAIIYLAVNTYANNKIKINEQSTTIERLESSIKLYNIANNATNVVLKKIILNNEQMLAKSSKIESKLKKAMKNEKINFNDLLSADVVLAFCLRYQNANSNFDAARSTYPNKGNPITSKCEQWTLTIADIFEWTGQLLDYAGRERADKQGLGEWSSRVKGY